MRRLWWFMKECDPKSRGQNRIRRSAEPARPFGKGKMSCTQTFSALMLSLLAIALISGQGCPSGFPAFDDYGLDLEDTGYGGGPGSDAYFEDDDICAVNGWYGDGICDEDCWDPDPDCFAGEGDFCAQAGWYGDGVCDPDCPLPDPDCEGYEDDYEGDFCEAYGWYGDGVCDPDCPLPDPDCEGYEDDYEGDFCEEYGWYGDGTCDSDCPLPDPDCTGW